jgi:hypothetical protein
MAWKRPAPLCKYVLMATTTLPPNWFDVLNQIEHTLTQAIQLAQNRESALPEATSTTFLVLPDFLTKHFEGLNARLRYVEGPLRELDETFQADEEHVRAQLARFVDLRQRLANWISKVEPANGAA